MAEFIPTTPVYIYVYIYIHSHIVVDKRCKVMKVSLNSIEHHLLDSDDSSIAPDPSPTDGNSAPTKRVTFLVVGGIPTPPKKKNMKVSYTWDD